MKRAWQRIRSKAGVMDVRFHDLRRTMGSWLASSGESLQLIEKVLNHSSVSTTVIYVRLDINPMRQALERNADRMLDVGESRKSAMIREIPETCQNQLIQSSDMKSAVGDRCSNTEGGTQDFISSPKLYV